MTRSRHIFRFLLALAALLLSLQVPAAAGPGKVGVLQDGTRRFEDGIGRPDEHAILAEVIAGGNAATRQRGDETGGRGPAFSAEFCQICPVVQRHSRASAGLPEYRRRNADIVTAQFVALFPKHWFW